MKNIQEKEDQLKHEGQWVEHQEYEEWKVGSNSYYKIIGLKRNTFYRLVKDYENE